MKINSQLKELYTKHWQGFSVNGAKIINPIPTNPLLLHFDETSFSQADLRIMICGQETWNWGTFGGSIDHCMSAYDTFFIQKKFYDGYGVSSFWKAFRFFESQFSEFFPQKKLQFIWQNLAKIGRGDDETGVTAEIRNLERTHFPVFKDEMKILKPDIVIFLTGPDRDHDLRFHFPDATFSQAGGEKNLRRRAWVSSSELPPTTLRLYHPCYFRAWKQAYKHEAADLIHTKMLPAKS